MTHLHLRGCSLSDWYFNRSTLPLVACSHIPVEILSVDESFSCIYQHNTQWSEIQNVVESWLNRDISSLDCSNLRYIQLYNGLKQYNERKFRYSLLMMKSLEEFHPASLTNLSGLSIDLPWEKLVKFIGVMGSMPNLVSFHCTIYSEDVGRSKQKKRIYRSLWFKL